ncbi:hydroxypyruvate reductase [Pacificibacter maritimus]|uniref:Hydroxypyruvate reductase n=2 Tax=Pacificibacter maritimus TaxID=762213 RepID=A0A3N4UKM0_9RHOB|nr:hydroxypyruvate reductase [Pacificibacter maritimus]
MDTRTRAMNYFTAGVDAADPERGVEAALAGAKFSNPTLIAIGKAARAMTQAALRHMSPETVIVVTNYENAMPLAGAEVIAAAHPIPDAEGACAALRVEEALSMAQGDVVILISGGGSALLPAPVMGVSLEDKAKVNAVLLASGADIGTMNLVRQQLSRLKGGGLLRAAAPSFVTTLALSDVVDNDLRVIASGPSIAPIGTREDAVTALKHLNIWEKMPRSVQEHLTAPEPDLGPLPDSEITLVGSNQHSVDAMVALAQAEAPVHVYPSPLVGDVGEAAQKIIDFSQSAGEGKGVYLFGGETTVALTGDGLGGRNQELCLQVVKRAKAQGITNFTFLSGGTDGRDGPTDAAGGIVDDATTARLVAAGLDLDDVLARNDSYHALEATGDLLKIGATGTNVADLQVFIRE